MFYAIGFPIHSNAVWNELARSAYEEGSTEQVSYGEDMVTVHTWEVGAGIAVVAVVSGEHLLALFPAFQAHSSTPVQVTRLERQPDVPVAYLNFTLGTLPTACFLSNLLTSVALPRPGLQATLRLCGLVESINVEVGGQNQASGLVALRDLGQQSDPAWFDFGGTISEYASLTNPASQVELLWLRLDVQGTPGLEVLTLTENVNGAPQVGGFAAGRCWLQGQVEA